MARNVLTNLLPGLKAGADLSSSQYKVVKFASTAGEVVAVSATTDNAIGVLQNDPADGEAALIAITGSIATCIAGVADLAVGELVGFNTSAQVADHTTDTRLHIGMAVEASTAVGDEVSVILFGLSGHST